MQSCNPASVVAQAELHNPGSCASRVARSWTLRKLSCAILEVAQAKLRNPTKELRNPSCAIRRSCGIGLYSQKPDSLSTLFGKPFFHNLSYELIIVLWPPSSPKQKANWSTIQRCLSSGSSMKPADRFAAKDHMVIPAKTWVPC